MVADGRNRVLNGDAIVKNRKNVFCYDLCPSNSCETIFTDQMEEELCLQGDNLSVVSLFASSSVIVGNLSLFIFLIF